MGTISFIAPSSYGGGYEFDIPFKYYYPEMNEILKNENYTKFLETSDKDYSVIYFKYVTTDKSLNVFFKSIKGVNPFIRINDAERKLSEIQKFWILSLYFGIFHCDRPLYDMFEKSKYKDYDVQFCEINNEIFTNGVEIFWYYSKQHYKFLPENGYLNYTMYRSFNDKQDPLNKVDINYADKIYYFNNDKIEEKTLEAAAEFLSSKINSELKRNQKLEIATYNLSHTYGSHQLPDTTDYLTRVRNRIDEIYENTCSSKIQQELQYEKSELYLLKADYNKQFQNSQQFEMDAMALTNRLSNPVDTINFQSFSFDNVISGLYEKYFSKDDDSNLIENFLGRGVCDGLKSAVLDFDYDKKNNDDINILLPFGDLGKVAFTMLLANIFRNCDKHSYTEYKMSLNDEFQQFNNRKEGKSIYKLATYWEDAEDKLKDDYIKINIVEKSRNYFSKKECTCENTKCECTNEESCKCENGFEKCEVCGKPNKENHIEDIVDDLNQKFFDYSEENNDSWKGLKEMKNISALLIGCPIEELNFKGFDFETVDHIQTKNHGVFPSRIISVGIEKDNENLYLKHIVYLKKEQFATIWIQENWIEGNCKKKIATITEILKSIGVKIKTEDDEKDLHSSVKFVIDCNFGKFNDIKTNRRHSNFRFIKDREEKIFNLVKNINKENTNSLLKEIKNQWISSDLFTIRKLSYVNEKESNEKDKEKIVFDLTESSQDNSKYAIIDNHFLYCKKNNIEDYPYIECNSSKSGSSKLVEPNDEILYEQLEAVNTEILILDENLQIIKNRNTAKDSDPDWSEKKFRDTLRWKGIHIPTQDEINLDEWFKSSSQSNNQDLDSFIERIKNTQLISNRKENLYIILHYSGFQKLIQQQNNKEVTSEQEILDDAFEKILKELELKNTSKYLVLMSGKYPGVLPKRSLFLGRSTLESLIQSKNNKYELVQTLNALRFKTKTL